jgi:large subunit ribosomal protein L18
MSEQTRKVANATQRANRTRSTLHGTSIRPRLSVNISNMHVSAQIINDDEAKTLCAATTAGNTKLTGTMTEKATVIGKEIAKKAKASKISKVVFDRGNKKYHGRIKALADAARAEGLEF